MSIEDAHLESVPHVLYRMYDDERRLLYIGISAVFGKRLDKHLRDKAWFPNVAYIAVGHFPGRTAVLEAERRAIVTERPKYNLAHGGGARDPFRDAPRTTVRIEHLPSRDASVAAPAWPVVTVPGTGQVRDPTHLMALSTGDRVRHHAFGFGTVMAVRGVGESRQAEVQFTVDIGAKWLLLKYAPLVAA